MRLLLINSVCGSGSTGVITTEIADYLKANGHECAIAYGQGSSTYPDSFKFDLDIENKLHALISSRILGLQGYGSVLGTRRLISFIKKFKPDLIHFHNLHGNYLNFPMLLDYIAKHDIPIVWSFYDTWPITGKCTHFTASGCIKWQTRCENCPQLHISGAKTYFFDRTNKMHEDKDKLISSLPSLDIIVCSKWLKREVEQSYVKNRPIHMIYNWIDDSKFSPIIDDSIYNKYGICQEKKYLVSVSALWSNNGTRFRDAVKLANLLPSDYQLVIIGSKDNINIPDNIIHIPFVKGTAELSKLYTQALAFVGFSVEDSFGKVFAEAMLCGTPCVVFDSTACPEVVGDCGYAVQPHNVEAMIEAIKRIDALGKDKFSERCISRVKSEFNYEKNVDKILRLYSEIINR